MTAGTSQRTPLGLYGLPLKDRVDLPRSVVGTDAPVSVLCRSSATLLGRWLLLVAVADPATASVRRDKNLARALGMVPKEVRHDPGSGRVRAGMTRLTQRLERLDLLERIDDRGQTFRLKDLDGSGGAYRTPVFSASDPTISLPGSFFQNWWHTELDSPAIAFLLIALAEASRQYPYFAGKGWTKSLGSLSRDYGLNVVTLRHGRDTLATRGVMRFQFPQADGGLDAFSPLRYEIHLEPFDSKPKDAPWFNVKRKPMPGGVVYSQQARRNIRKFDYRFVRSGGKGEDM